MRLNFYRGARRNFGDELNTIMWQHILPPGFLDDDPSVLFLGIGSIISNDYPKNTRMVVCGSGYGGYTPPPDVRDGSWEIEFVRGPQTAEVLGIDRSLAITDAAVLVREMPLPEPADGIRTAFMPHFHSLDRGRWADVCKLAGIHYLDPSDPPESLLARIRGADLVITEAMHGAILADALRTPWIPVRTQHKEHRFKWFDWTRSLGLEHRPRFLFPSSAREGWVTISGLPAKGAHSRRLFDGHWMAPVNLAARHIAARNLQKIAEGAPELSDERVISEVTERAMEAVKRLVDRYRPSPPIVRVAE